MLLVLATPTFAAGLGVVIAAFLAYPTSQVSLRYPPPTGQPCPLKGCPTPSRGPGALASAPSRRLVTRSPKPRPRGSGAPSASGPEVTYQTVRQWNGHFVAALTVTPDAPIPASGWTMRIRYPSAQIIGVRGGKWQPDGVHTAVIQQWGNGSKRPGNQVRVFITVAGPVGPPASCSFDGQTCRVKVSSRGSGGWGGLRHHHLHKH